MVNYNRARVTQDGHLGTVDIDKLYPSVFQVELTTTTEAEFTDAGGGELYYFVVNFNADHAVDCLKYGAVEIEALVAHTENPEPGVDNSFGQIRIYEYGSLAEIPANPEDSPFRESYLISSGGGSTRFQHKIIGRYVLITFELFGITWEAAVGDYLSRLTSAFIPAGQALPVTYPIATSGGAIVGTEEGAVYTVLRGADLNGDGTYTEAQVINGALLTTSEGGSSGDNQITQVESADGSSTDVAPTGSPITPALEGQSLLTLVRMILTNTAVADNIYVHVYDVESISPPTDADAATGYKFTIPTFPNSSIQYDYDLKFVNSVHFRITTSRTPADSGPEFAPAAGEMHIQVIYADAQPAP